MKKISYIVSAGLVLGSLVFTGCDNFLDINKDPDNIVATNAPLPQLLTAAQANLGFEGGSDKFRYAALISQHLSGQANPLYATYEYDRYNISGSDQNNLWSSVFSSTLSDLELIIKNATANGSPHYAGVAKILKAYEYQIAVDTWGDLPYTEALQLDGNTQPAYDDAKSIYTNLIALCDQGIADLNAAQSNLSPAETSIIYPGDFADTKTQWIKLANTLKMRMFLHYSKLDPAFMKTQIDALVNSKAPLMESNDDSFVMNFLNEANRRNPIHSYEVSRPNYLFAGAHLVDMMNAKEDPRRTSYFVAFPYGSGKFKGVKAGDPATFSYSRINTYLRGAVSGTPKPDPEGGITGTALTYTGDAPIRMLNYSEYCFIRAEATLLGAAGDAQAWFTKGITASMEGAGVAAKDIATYLTANGTLTGTTDAKIKQVIEEKYVSLYGVAGEAWTDFRRTGYPALVAPSNAVVKDIPRSLYYAQGEIDTNPKIKQKANLQTKVFWDK